MRRVIALSRGGIGKSDIHTLVADIDKSVLLYIMGGVEPGAWDAPRGRGACDGSGDRRKTLNLKKRHVYITNTCGMHYCPNHFTSDYCDNIQTPLGSTTININLR